MRKAPDTLYMSERVYRMQVSAIKRRLTIYTVAFIVGVLLLVIGASTTATYEILPALSIRATIMVTMVVGLITSATALLLTVIAVVRYLRIRDRQCKHLR